LEPWPGERRRFSARGRSASGRGDGVVAFRHERCDLVGGLLEPFVDASGLRDLADDLEHRLRARGSRLGLGSELTLLGLGPLRLGVRLRGLRCAARLLLGLVGVLLGLVRLGVGLVDLVLELLDLGVTLVQLLAGSDECRRGSRSSDCLLFSYATLTTTGYGNLVPAGTVGQSFAVLEMLVGQIFLVTLLAGLVSLWRPGSTRTRPAAPTPDRTRPTTSSSPGAPRPRPPSFETAARAGPHRDVRGRASVNRAQTWLWA
jgi:hypothetical protein